MKLNPTRITTLFIVAVICTAALLLIAAAPYQGAEPPVQPDNPAELLPVILVLGVTALVNYLVTNGLKGLTAALPWVPNLEGYGTSLSAAITSALLLYISNGLALLPPELQNPVGVIAGYLITLFMSYGLAELAKRFTPRPVGYSSTVGYWDTTSGPPSMPGELTTTNARVGFPKKG